jgi:hypothetical protein
VFPDSKVSASHFTNVVDSRLSDDSIRLFESGGTDRMPTVVQDKIKISLGDFFNGVMNNRAAWGLASN